MSQGASVSQMEGKHIDRGNTISERNRNPVDRGAVNSILKMDILLFRALKVIECACVISFKRILWEHTLLLKGKRDICR